MKILIIILFIISCILFINYTAYKSPSEPTTEEILNATLHAALMFRDEVIFNNSRSNVSEIINVQVTVIDSRTGETIQNYTKQIVN